MGPPTKPHSWCVPPVKILSCWARQFSSYKDLNFLSCRLKSHIRAPKISVFGGFYPPKFRGTSFRPPKGTSMSGTTRFELSLVQIERTVQPVAFPKKPKKERKTKDSGKVAIRPDHSRRRIEVKVCMPCGLRCVVLYFKFY